MYRLYLLASLCVFSTVFCQNANQPTVTIAQGKVVGSIVADGNYNVFYGIPYAGSTAGANRFKAPPPAPVFPGDFHAIDSSKICAQPRESGLIGDENCLVVNIYSKNLTIPKPVLVWVDGEDYTTTTNNALYSYKKIVEQNVVLVTINYRVSVFGFLCLGVAEAPGNAGLKDIIAGLQWIKQNIAPFGGNPNNVVLFGHGSGAAMVDLVTLSPLAEGLIHKAIASSGTSLAPWAVSYNPVDYAESLGRKLGYKWKSKSELAQLFVNTDISVLGGALTGFDFLNNTVLFAPCIEDNRLNLNSTFLGSAPIDIIRSGKYNHVPFIAGYADRDGTHRLNQAEGRNFLLNMKENFTNALPADLINRDQITQSIRDFYFGTKEINFGAIEDYLDYEGDTLFLLSTIKAVAERALTSTAPVRLYQFAYRGTQNSDWTHPGVAITGATHRSILKYLFDYDLLFDDIPMQNILIGRWVAFANSGVPDVADSAAWATVPKNRSISVLTISHANQIIDQENSLNPHSQRRAFWDPIYASNYVVPKAVSGSAAQVFSFALVIAMCQIISRFLS